MQKSKILDQSSVKFKEHNKILLQTRISYLLSDLNDATVDFFSDIKRIHTSRALCCRGSWRCEYRPCVHFTRSRLDLELPTRHT